MLLVQTIITVITGKKTIIAKLRPVSHFSLLVYANVNTNQACGIAVMPK
jgi:hypothetical protein